ncbi:MAG: 4Fe-4S binding protein [Thiohalocapsa sp. PB-PSB1]|jgi:predicted membrane-bound spermidine synthase|nr:MAG: 4Fe-4S binding protein [Thiohalocapsa sp. PB-PSB1]HCS90386.1 hypothetical protein [Chromatiaceae bacterium]
MQQSVYPPLLPLLAVLVLGAFAQIAQALLIRESLVVFYGNEASLGAFYGSWLWWLTLGSLAALRWQPSHPASADEPGAALRRVRILLLLLPLILMGQVVGLRVVRFLLDVSAGQLVPLGELLIAMLLVTLPIGILLGFAFPLVCRALQQAKAVTAAARPVGAVASTYVAEALGALLGGLVFTFVMIRWLGLVETLALVCLCLALTAALLPSMPAHSGRRRKRLLFQLAPWGLALTALILLQPAISMRLDRGLEVLRFATLQPGMELLDASETPYGHVAVARLGEQTSVVADGQIQQSFPLPREVETWAAYFYAQAQGAQRVLVLGGYAGGLATELLRYPLQRLDQVEQDRAAFEQVRPYLNAPERMALDDPRLRLHFGDGRRFLGRLSDQLSNQSGDRSNDQPSDPMDADLRYDLILSLDASPASAAGNRFFTQQAFALARGLLNPDGVFCTEVMAASNYLGRVVEGYAGSVYRTLNSVFRYVALVPGEVQVFCASDAPGRLSQDARELLRRYRASPRAEHGLPDGAFATLLPAQDVAFVRGQLDQAMAQDRLPLNTDAQPVTYYLNMLLWGKQSASGFVDWLQQLQRLGPWPYLLPSLLMLALGLVRWLQGGISPATLSGRAGVFALASLGAVAMAGELALLFSFQAQVGLVFERVALLTGLFMTGLAVGGGLARRVATGRRGLPALVLILAAIAIGVALLPVAIGALTDARDWMQQVTYLVLSLTLGGLSGAGFTLCLGLAARSGASLGAKSGSALISGSIALAADNLGGALGGLVAGTLMVPILGVSGTCQVLAALAAIAILPVAMVALADRWPRRSRAASARARPSFPWPRLGWGLLYLVLLLYGWHLIAQQSRPEPQVRFDPERLAEVGGQYRFEPKPEPWIHYLGFAPGARQPEALVLASAAALTGSGGEPNGFAGPIRLLIGLDRDGLLRGVRYLESNETPSYIAGIDAWLRALVGWDLSKGPLELDRIDGLSGATVTSRAALATLNAAARQATEVAFGTSIPPSVAAQAQAFDWSLYAIAALLLLFFPVYLSGSEGWRLALQVASLVLLGFWLNSLLTELDLVNLSQGQTASPAEHPERWLLLGFVALTSLLFGQVWCGYLCPFGALQELFSRLGRRLGLRSYPQRSLEQRMRYLKFLLLAALLILVWMTGEGIWATFDPMQHIFSDRIWDSPWSWMTLLSILVLAASLIYVRFWCRYFCPLGAFLALGNKIAFAQRLAPRRRFEHCDLGVRGEYDLDCIRCNRCLTATDTRVRNAKRVDLSDQ